LPNACRQRLRGGHDCAPHWCSFFQPDEFFQSLEPAWQLAFGTTGDAWITWVNAFHVDIVGCLSHDTSRSGECSCGRPCIQGYLLPSIESRQIWQACVA
jgi:hypothetical protein